MSGILYGLGVGPGDPELITLKALKVLERAPVIAYPAPETGDSLARSIAGPHIPEGRTEIVIRTPMVVGKFPAHDVYDRYAAKIDAYLSVGKDVAVLCEGDPFLYGSFMYLFSRLSAKNRVEVVPGVSSLGACAAAIGAPLASRNQVLTILPGPLEEDELEARIQSSPAVAIMKVGRHLEKICRVLDRLGLTENAQYIEHATMSGQRVLKLGDVTKDGAPYFSMILVRHGETDTGV
tara:strand:+ start:94 stop:801 length:708 start_codon:yes stop_codon:yes gene_type:complete